MADSTRGAACRARTRGRLTSATALTRIHSVAHDTVALAEKPAKLAHGVKRGSYPLLEAFQTALQRLLAADPALWSIVGLSLKVSLSATALASLVGLPLGAVLAVSRFPGRQILVVVINALMGLPPVVIGLSVYLLLSRAGPLGEWGILFTPAAMVIAQSVLVLPIVAALARQVVDDAWGEYSEQLRSLGVSAARAALTLLWDTRFALLTVVLAGFGRAIAEVGAVMVVGGNIEGVTRVMTTAIALETSRGDLSMAMALGLVLVLVVMVLNSVTHLLRESARRYFG